MTRGVPIFVSLFCAGRLFAQPADAQDATSYDTREAKAWLFPAERLNGALPRWLQVGGEFRSRFESQNGIDHTSTNDAYLLTQLRLNVSIQPAKWITFFGEAQDSRVFFNQEVPSAVPYQNTWDIRQAYVQIGSSKEGWGDLMVGRQVLAFGDERVIGPSDWLNMGRTFDAVRLNLHQSGYEVSLFASAVVNGVDGSMDHHLPGNNLYGIYGSFRNAIPVATVEPYVLWRVAPADAALPETANLGHLNETTVGLRVAGTLPAGFDYETEMDRQLGSLGSNSIQAWAGYWNVGRTYPSVSAAPRIFIESNYASGTNDPRGHTWSTFDQIYPSNHDKLDFADQFGRKNIQQVRAGIEESIARKWKLRQTYEELWLATTSDALYASSGVISVAADPAASSRHIGREVDLTAQYQVNRKISFGFGYAHLFSGKFLKTTTPGKDYSYPFLDLTYRF